VEGGGRRKKEGGRRKEEGGRTRREAGKRTREDKDGEVMGQKLIN
jgi:hypothetical protein